MAKPMNLMVGEVEVDLHSTQEEVEGHLDRTWVVAVAVLVVAGVDLVTSTLAVPFRCSMIPETHLEEAGYLDLAVAGMADNQAVEVVPSYVEALVEVVPSCVVVEDLPKT